MREVKFYEQELGVTEEDYYQDDCFFKDTDDRKEVWEAEREKYGFDSREMWNLDANICLFLYPRLRMYRDRIVSFPATFDNLDNWKSAVDKMIEGFRLAYTLRDWDYNEGCEEKREEMEEGLYLFAKHFKSLWT